MGEGWWEVSLSQLAGCREGHGDSTLLRLVQGRRDLVSRYACALRSLPVECLLEDSFVSRSRVMRR